MYIKWFFKITGVLWFLDMDMSVIFDMDMSKTILWKSQLENMAIHTCVCLYYNYIKSISIIVCLFICRITRWCKYVSFYMSFGLECHANILSSALWFFFAFTHLEWIHYQRTTKFRLTFICVSCSSIQMGCSVAAKVSLTAK